MKVLHDDFPLRPARKLSKSARLLWKSRRKLAQQVILAERSLLLLEALPTGSVQSPLPSVGAEELRLLLRSRELGSLAANDARRLIQTASAADPIVPSGGSVEESFLTIQSRFSELIYETRAFSGLSNGRAKVPRRKKKRLRKAGAVELMAATSIVCHLALRPLTAEEMQTLAFLATSLRPGVDDLLA